MTQNISRGSFPLLCAALAFCMVYQSEGKPDTESSINSNSCTCVRFDLCKSNGTSVTNGTFTDIARDNGTTATCPNNLDICCEDTDKQDSANLSMKNLTVENLTEKVFENNITESSNNASSCTCMPIDLCNLYDGTGVIDVRPCERDLEICCKAISNTTELPLRPEMVGCGKRNEDGVGFRAKRGLEANDVAEFGEFPWMITILQKTNIGDISVKVYLCGGALIHPQVVMTAAHCVSPDQDFVDRLNIRVGEWDTQTGDEIYPHQDSDVSSVTVHPQYNKGRLYNDIALLFLKTPVAIQENVNVVCLPTQDEVVESSKCFVTGWGKDVFGDKGKYQVVLKKVEVPIVARSACQDSLRKKTKLGRFFELHQSFVCAGGESGKDSCKGDGGGPLVCPIRGDEERYSQVGIVAWGSGCGEAGVPGIYVNVALFRNWIDEQMTLKNLDLYSYQSRES